LWPKAAAMLSEKGSAYGKRQGWELDVRKLGPPYLEATLEPGDVLYVPRGCLHATSTSGLEERSLHWTVGIEDAATVGVLLQRALRHLQETSIAFRASVDNATARKIGRLRPAAPERARELYSEFAHLLLTSTPVRELMEEVL
jgi:ribosomal protein L16 Arg81 hydroxylase